MGLEAGDNEYGCRGTDGAEELAMDMADGFPVFDVVRYMRVRTTPSSLAPAFPGVWMMVRMCAFDGVGFVCAYGAGAGDVDGVDDAHGSEKPMMGSKGRRARDVLAHRWCS